MANIQSNPFFSGFGANNPLAGLPGGLDLLALLTGQGQIGQGQLGQGGFSPFGPLGGFLPQDDQFGGLGLGGPLLQLLQGQGGGGNLSGALGLLSLLGR